MNSAKSPIRLYNTLSKTKEDFVPLDATNVRMYVCGPTVYDYAHIGNARPAIVFDVLFRLLRHVYGETCVTYVRNITDVDDKINARAARDFPDMPLNEAIGKLTKTTEEQYQADMKALGCLEPDEEPRATNHIGEMIEMIATLIEKEHAYAADGHVLFSVKSFKSGDTIQYGKLARRTLDDMIAGARVEVAPYKRDPMDFVLWKPSAENEPGWDSPWSKGRPGWHIECSAMSKKYLGEVFDIHGGGIDLSFPHHENELAQSCCANDQTQMAQIWMHNGFLQIEGEKMSKSEGNFFTVHDLLHTEKFGGRKWPGDVLRVAMLMTHYRKPIDFSVAKLQEAERMLGRWKRAIAAPSIDPILRSSSEVQRVGREAVVGFLSDDLNSPNAITTIQSLARSALGGHQPAIESLRLSAELMGIGLDWHSEDYNTPNMDLAPIQEAISARLAAIAEKNWVEADRIRDELTSQGIQLMDSKDPDTGERITTWEIKR